MMRGSTVVLLASSVANGLHAPPLLSLGRPLRHAAPRLCGGVPLAQPPTDLVEKAKYFVMMKNMQNRDAVFEMCAPDADVYGFVGAEAYREGLTKFFKDHTMLMHALLEEPELVGTTAVQYAFEKSWQDASGEQQVWKSVDPIPDGKDGRPGEPRDKVEKLEFDAEGRLIKVSVVKR